MSIYKNATFNDITYGKFIRGRNIEVRQDILDRTQYLLFSSTLQDYNVLTRIFPADFFLLPSKTRRLIEGDRLDNIAYEAYGDPDFWWILARFNRITDPRDLSDLTEMEIPLETFVMNYLLTKILEWT